MRTHVFLQKGTWLKCALHAHTTNSDGELAPADLVRHYEEAGFDALVITDHWIRTVEPSTERLLVVPGTELDALRRDGKTYAHVLALGVESDPEPPAADFPGLEETVAWVRANGGVPFIAHTYWSGLRTDEFEEIEGLAGIEVFNAGCELEVGRGHAGLHWDEALQSRARPARHRDRRLPPPGQGQRAGVGVGPLRGEEPGGGPRRSRLGLLLQLERTGDRGARDRGRRRRRPLQPRAQHHASHRPDEGRARERGRGRLHLLGRGARDRRQRPHHRGAAHTPTRDAATDVSRSRTKRGRRAWTNPLWP